MSLLFFFSHLAEQINYRQIKERISAFGILLKYTGPAQF